MFVLRGKVLRVVVRGRTVVKMYSILGRKYWMDLSSGNLPINRPMKLTQQGSLARGLDLAVRAPLALLSLEIEMICRKLRVGRRSGRLKSIADEP